jgi:hypothetical protein
MFRRSITILLLLFTLFAAHPGTAHANSKVIDIWKEYSFGDQITFYAKVESDQPIVTAIVFFQAINDSNTIVGLASVTPVNDGIYQIEYVHQLSDYTIQAFSTIEYRFEITSETNETFETTSKTFYYEDNRFDWKKLEEGSFRVHWYAGDLQFAQNVLDTAQAGLKQIQSFLLLPAPPEIDIYIYSDTTSMQGVLNPGSQDWVAGHADPELGVIVTELPEGPDQQLLMKQRIPHELMHILLFQSTYPGYRNIPTWLNEGLATNAEIYPNPDYRITLQNAVEGESLIPMSSLCNTFPRNNSDALLSYAQSFSFTNYLYRTYGTSGLEELVTAYANGMDCERGAEAALGSNLSQLERSWRQKTFSENLAGELFNNLTPWFILLLAMLIAPGVILVQIILKKAINKTADQPTG